MDSSWNPIILRNNTDNIFMSNFEDRAQQCSGQSGHHYALEIKKDLFPKNRKFTGFFEWLLLNIVYDHIDRICDTFEGSAPVKYPQTFFEKSCQLGVHTRYKPGVCICC